MGKGGGMNRMPLEKRTVTVLTPVYNGAPYLREAIESILSQTFVDFEFLIINDGSTDESAEIIKSYRDPRIRLVENERNLGLAATRNRGLALAVGEYIAKMDCDDISTPDRLAKQVNFMNANAHIGACGSWVKKIGARKDVWKVKTDDDSIRARLLFESALAQPSVMLRKSMLTSYGIRYDANLNTAEDYGLWVNIARHSKLANIAEVLLYYRVHPAQVSIEKLNVQMAAADKVRIAQLDALGITPTDEEKRLHSAIATMRCDRAPDFFDKTHAWLARLRTANREKNLYSESALEKELSWRWYKVCNKMTCFGCHTWKRYRASEFGRNTLIPPYKKIGLLFKASAKNVYLNERP